MIILANDALITAATAQEKNGFRTTFSSSHNLLVGKGEEAKPCQIISMRHATEDYDDLPALVRWTDSKNPGGKMRASIVSNKRPKGNAIDIPIAILAIPFNGILAPVEKVEGLRIHRAFIAKAPEKTPFIEYDGKKYRKVVYMVVTPNTRLFDLENENVKDHISMKVETYSLQSSSSGVRDTIKQTFTITFIPTLAGVHCTWTTNWEKSDPVSINDFGDGFLFPLYKPSPRHRGTNTNGSEKSRGNTKRSEKPKRNGTSGHKTSLDAMLDSFDSQSKERQQSIRDRSKKHHN